MSKTKPHLSDKVRMIKEFEPFELKGKRVLVIGLGITGIWCIRWLLAQGARVAASDSKIEDELAPKLCGELREKGVILQTGGHDKATLLNSDMIVISPGVPYDMEELNEAKKQKIPVIGELEMASRLIETPIISITGTNGKSTVTALVGAMLENAGYRVFIGGNLGTPLIAYACGPQDADYAVVEVSSFQLDSIETFCPYTSVILNISPDHLDRYKNYEHYAQSKLRIYSNQGPGHYLILNDDDERLAGLNPDSPVRVLRYGFESKEGRSAFFNQMRLFARMEGRPERGFSLDKTKLPGRHNVANIMAAVLCAMTAEVEPDVIQQTIETFKGLPHRLEWIREFKGVNFYNDSKATNIDAAVRAIESFDQPIVLIAGGRGKGTDYNQLLKASMGRVKQAVFMGESKKALADCFKGTIAFEIAMGMDEAVSIAFSSCRRGDIVLLAPACASFDMYEDFAHRGRAFKEATERLANGV